MRETQLATRIWVPNRALTFNEDLWPTLHSDGTRRLRIALTGMRRPRESSSRSAKQKGPIAMPRENDLEGVQDQGGKHGGQKGMPKPEPRPAKSGPRPGQLPIKASYVTSRDRSSRATKSALSKPAERIRSDDECPEAVHSAVRNVPVTRPC